MTRLDRNDEQRKQAMILRLSGLSFGDIGEQLGISRQRVQQITSPPARVWRAVRDRDRGLCVDCGIRPQSGHVHHKDQEVETEDSYNSPDNLVYLCPSCHRIRHSGGIPALETTSRNIRFEDGMFEVIQRQAALENTTAPQLIIKMLREELAKWKPL